MIRYLTTVVATASLVFSSAAPVVAEIAPAPQRPALRMTADPPPETTAIGAIEANYEEILSEAEESCEKGKLHQLPCALNVDQIERIRPGIETAIAELGDLAHEIPEARILGAGPRSAPNVTKFLTALTKQSKNVDIKKLGEHAGKFADWTGRVQTTVGPLTENSAVVYAKAAIGVATSFFPPTGELWSFADAASTGDATGMLIATVSLAAFAIGVAFPPAGAIISAGIAIFNVGRFLWNFFMVKDAERDWIADPPGTPQEMFASGADMQWVSHKVEGLDGNFNMTYAQNKLIATQTLLLNSKWTKYNEGRQPVKYTIPTGKRFYQGMTIAWNVMSVVSIVWQDGKAYTASCSAGPTAVHGVPVGGVTCDGLSDPVTISLDHPAVLEIRYIVRNYEELYKKVCKKLPCTTEASFGEIKVLSEGKEEVRIKVPFDEAII